MAGVETRPFRAPTRSAVDVEVELVEPRVPIEALSVAWEPGHRIVLRVRAQLSSEFWDQTDIPSDEEVHLVGIVTCLPARTNWRSMATFRESADGWTAETLVEIDGNVVAVEILADGYVVGNGRTGSPDAARSVHVGAKLWQLPQPIRLSLEDERTAFPTTPISFGETGRRDVPWTVEITPDADPEWGIGSAIRLYINTDSGLASAIAEGTAAEDIFALIQSDIHLVVLHRLAGWRDTVSPARMEQIADVDPGTLAALGASIATGLGVPLGEALRLAREEPLELAARSRESLVFGRYAETS